MKFKLALLISSVFIETTIASRYSIFLNSNKITNYHFVNIQFSTHYIAHISYITFVAMSHNSFSFHFPNLIQNRLVNH